MFSCNDERWPVIIFEFTGLQTLEDHAQSLDLWDQYFARNKSFIAIRVFHDEESLVHPEGSPQLTKQWLRSGAAESIKKSVIAMINIVPENSYERMKNMSVEAVFGVPGGVFKNRNDAIDWFNGSVGTRIDYYLEEILVRLN